MQDNSRIFLTGLAFLLISSCSSESFLIRSIPSDNTLSVSAGAKVIKSIISEEFQVNNESAGYMKGVSMDANKQGNYVIAWTNLKDVKQTDPCIPVDNTIEKGLSARVFNSQGMPVAGQFNVLLQDEGNYSNYSVKITDTNKIIIFWQNRDKMYAQRFSITGLPLDNDLAGNSRKFLLNTGGQLDSAEVDHDDNIIISWMESLPFGSDIYARKFDHEFRTFGEKFRVNSFNKVGHERRDQEGELSATDCQGNVTTKKIYGDVYYERSASQIASGSSGDFIITWVSRGQESETSNGIYAQRFNKNGNKTGVEFKVNKTEDFTSFPDIAITDSGDFVIVWNSYHQVQLSQSDVLGQRFDSNGNKAGYEFLVNSLGGGQKYPDIAIDNTGNFAVSWTNGNDRGDILLQKFDKNGIKIGNEISQNSHNLIEDETSQVIMSGNGNFVSAWTAKYRESTDKTNSGVFSRQLINIE
jgi:hypothetical protein